MERDNCTGAALAMSTVICGGAPCDGVRWRSREVRYSFRCDVARSGDGRSASCSLEGALGVTGREFSVLGPCLNDDCALLLSEPLRDRYGELDPLASTHSSSGSSLPRSKCTWILLDLAGCRCIPVPLEVRLSLSDDRVRLPTSTWERLRFKLVWDKLLGRLAVDDCRGSLTSLVARRCGGRCEVSSNSNSVGDVGREVDRRFSFEV